MFSHAREVAHYLQQRRVSMRVASVLYVVLAAAYLVWRPSVFNPNEFWPSLVFYLADVFSCLLGLAMIYVSWSIRVREVKRPSSQHLKVDVFLPVYTEPADMIELTVIGAKEIAYPHQTFLLDDGRRPEIRAIAEKHGVRYVTRPDNRGAKAGNLNHALTLSTAEFIAVFDADHIATRESLDTLLGNFEDPLVGMSHAPQNYYNEDCFLYREVYVGAARWHEQAHCMDVFQASRDHYDGSSGMGTGVIYRRSAIDAIGGFPEATLTEDLHTSLLMHKRGMKTAWVNEPVAWGVAAADIGEFYKTRRRWTYGNLQAFAVENLLFCRGLPWRIRLGYISMGLELLAGWYQLVYLLTPAFCMVLYVTPFRPDSSAAVIIMLMPLVLMAMTMLVSGGYLRFIPCQIFSMGKMFLQIESTRGLLGRKMAWQVSLKNVLGNIAFGRLAAHILVLGVSLLALVYAVLRYAGVIPCSTVPLGGMSMLLVSSLWVVFNTWRSWRWIIDSVRYTRRTHREYLFEVRVPVLNRAGEWIGSSSRLSTGQLEFESLEGAPAIKPGDRLQLLLPGHAIPLIVNAINGNGLLETACEDEASRDLLRRCLYSVDWHRMVRLSKHSYMAAERGLAGEWRAAIIVGEDGVKRWAMMLDSDSPDNTRRVMTEGPAPVSGAAVTLSFVASASPVTTPAVLGAQIAPAWPVPRGLNNNAFHFCEIMLNFCAP